MWSCDMTAKRAGVLFDQTGIQSYPVAVGKDRIIYSLAIAGPRSQVVRQVWWASADGTRAQQIFMDNADDAQVDVSPDGHKLAFASARGGPYQIWIAEADGSDPRRLTTGASAESDPNWSPDGRFVLLVGLRGSRTRLFVRPVAGGDASEVILEGLDGVPLRDPDWR